MAIILTRDNKSREGTHGTFELGGKKWHSMEPPDLGNIPFKSCVPLGEYDLIPHVSAQYGRCHIMSNPNLNVYPFEHSPGRPEDGRYLCLFVHRGNFARNFVGCVGASADYDEAHDRLEPPTVRYAREVNRLVTEEGSFKLVIRHEFE